MSAHGAPKLAERSKHRHARVDAEDAWVDAAGHHLRRGTVGDEDGHVAQLVEQLLRELGQRRFRDRLELVPPA